jgi:YydF family exported signaling peptide
MKKDIPSKDSVKKQKLEFKNLVDESQKLAKVNDLWYFVKSKQNRWIVGSGH